MMSMKNWMSAVALIASLGTLSAQDKGNVMMVGGEAMYPTKDIVTNAMNSKDHTTLVAAVKAAGLVETLQGPGPFTVFAPTNAAFDALPEGTVGTRLKPENKAMLAGILTYHVLQGTHDMKSIAAAIKKGGGKAKMKTVHGEELTFGMNGPSNIMVWDTKGGSANISVYDVMQKNGVIHVVDAVLMP